MSDSDSLKIRVTGLPGDITLPILKTEFRTLFRKIYVKQYCIEKLYDMDRDLKQMIVKLRYRADAHRAQNFFHSKPFVYNMMKYPLVVHNVEESEDLPKKDSEDRGHRSNTLRPEWARSRSRSPGYSQEARLDEHRPRTLHTFEDYKPHHNGHQREPVPQRSHEKYPPMEKVYRPRFGVHAGEDEPPPAELQLLVSHFERAGLAVIIGAESNAHHLLWGMETSKNRGQATQDTPQTSPETLQRGHETRDTPLTD
ncbi:uncharacterized protein LOC133531197 [Cydia pomonella]|uniref:uncharacterized protein LOC133531197 n=1 Tax=Cydia pomonella TaxID=82600 RepID=UPI002ADE543F|nr:uncharacterized protein LOC133531197 [Cydia pomonella]